MNRARRPLGKLVGLLACLASRTVAQSSEPCFAFLLRGDITVRCEARRTQITHRGNIEAFAISDARKTIVWRTSRIIRTDGVVAVGAATLEVTNLETGSRKTLQEDASFTASCGGILLDGRELLSNTQIETPYAGFRCSDDRSQILGIKQKHLQYNERTNLMSGSTSPNLVDSQILLDGFNISNDGTQFAWLKDHGSVCVQQRTAAPKCVSGVESVDEIFVSDAGEVLLTQHAESGCFYRSSYNFSPAPVGKANDACLAIDYWSRDMKKPVQLEALGRNPEWVSIETARMLRLRSSGKQFHSQK